MLSERQSWCLMTFLTSFGTKSTLTMLALDICIGSRSSGLLPRVSHFLPQTIWCYWSSYYCDIAMQVRNSWLYCLHSKLCHFLVWLLSFAGCNSMSVEFQLKTGLSYWSLDQVLKDWKTTFHDRLKMKPLTRMARMQLTSDEWVCMRFTFVFFVVAVMFLPYTALFTAYRSVNIFFVEADFNTFPLVVGCCWLPTTQDDT